MTIVFCTSLEEAREKLKVEEVEEKLTDEEAEALLKKLSKHFRQPVMPVSRYCKSLWTWMDCVVEAYEEDGSHKGARFSDIAPVMDRLKLAIQKSNLLWRLIYDGQPLRTKKCPEHQGHWRGVPFPHNDCEHGCDLTGWIPDDFVPTDPNGPCPHKWRVPRQEDRSLRCYKCDEKVGSY